MKKNPIYVEIDKDSTIDQVWNYTQHPTTSIVSEMIPFTFSNPCQMKNQI